MTEAELNEFRDKILTLRARLRGEVTQMTDSALETPLPENNGDPSSAAEFGSDNFEREFTLSLVESKDAALEQIDDALERIADGSYGICEECDTKIPRARLDAIPYAALCVNCAAAQERRAEEEVEE
jgi:DnaK suppressor protein